MTHEEWIETKFKNSKAVVTPISKFVKTSIKMKFLCVCGKEYEAMPQSALSGWTCGCGKFKKLTPEEQAIKDEINKIKEEKRKEREKRNKNKLKNELDKLKKLSIEQDLEEEKPIRSKFKSGSRAKGINLYRDKKTILYYLKVENLYKIGICLFNKGIEEDIKFRYQYEIKENINIEILDYFVYENGAIAYLEEQKIIETYKDYSYRGINILKSGNTELFIKDIINTGIHRITI